MPRAVRKKIIFNIVETTIILAFFSFIFFVSQVSAVEQEYPVDTVVPIGEFIYDDAYVATTTDCFVDIWAPYLDGNDELVPVISNVLMSTSTTGWHYYNYTGSSTPGTWPASIKCGTVGVDLIKGDKTFVLTTTTGSNGTATVDNAAIAAAVWNTATSTFVTIGSVGKHLVDTLDAAVSSIVSGGSLTAADVWSYSGRTLTDFGTLVADIWSYSTRTMTAFGNLAADVWNNTFAPTRSLTTKSLAGGGNIATESYTDIASSTLATKIENASSSLALLINAGASPADIETASTSLAVLINTRASQTSFCKLPAGQMVVLHILKITDDFACGCHEMIMRRLD